MKRESSTADTIRWRGRATIYLALFLGLLLLMVMTALPWAILGEWQHAREASAPAGALLCGWILHDLHTQRKLRRANG